MSEKSTTAPTQAAILRDKLVVVLDDLQKAGARDPDTMWLLGKFANDFAARFHRRGWNDLSGRITEAQNRQVLAAFREAGEQHLAAGRDRHAYAIQALALSWLARTLPDTSLRQGGALLDTVIEAAEHFYLQNPLPRPVPDSLH